MSLKPAHDGGAHPRLYEFVKHHHRLVRAVYRMLAAALLALAAFGAQADSPAGSRPAANGPGANPEQAAQTDSTPLQGDVAPTAPYLRAYPWSKGTRCTLFWTSVPNATGYLIQRDDAPDFKTPLQTVTVASAATLSYAFQLPISSDGQASWYRVRGIRQGGLAAPWSNVTSSTQDLQTPTVAFKINGGAATAASSLVALSVTGADPGTNPSGLHLMRFKLNNSNWTEWEPYAATHNLRLDPAKPAHTVYAEVMDRAGNVSFPFGARITLALRPVYVDGNYGVANSDGSLAHPYKSIQAAINAASAPADIFIAEGSYAEEISLKSGIALLGGFPRDNFSYAARKPETHPTSLLGGTTNMTLNKIVRMSNVTDVWLDGLTCGPHNVVAHDLVGFNNNIGIYCEDIGSSCRISNCTVRELGFIGPLTRLIGIDLENASPILDHCTVRDNRAHTGAAILCRSGSMPLIDRCLVANNQFSLGVMHSGPFPAEVGGYGAGISLYLAAPTIQNTIIQDTAGVYGLSYTQYGAAGIIDQSAYEMAGNSIPTIQNCTLYNNHIGIFTVKEGSIRNCIAWNNGLLNTITPTYSCLASWTGGGQGNISADPKFIDPVGGDFRLIPSSPCIDAGGAVPGLTTDFDGNPRGIQGVWESRGDGSRFDMGAYEYQPKAKLVAKPNFSVPDGSYVSPIRVRIGCPTAYATIRYTLDGGEPAEDSPVYTGPLMLKGKPGDTITIKAKAFRAGWVPSMVATAHYTIAPIVTAP